MKKVSSLLLSVLLFFIATNALFAKSKEEYLADLSPEKKSEVIVQAAEWAANEKEKSATDKLLVLLTDKREKVRLGSVIALGYIGDEKSVDSINKVLLEDISSDVRYAAVLSVVRIGSEKSLTTLKEALKKEKDPFIKDFLTKMKNKYEK